MLPQVPIFDPRKSYALKGETLNQWRDCLIRRVPLEGAGIEVDELPDGMLISSRAGSASLRLDFAASWTGAAGASDLQVQGGRVLGTDWTGFDPNDPLNAGWTEELATIATDELTVADGETVWLAISISSTDHESMGPLSSNGAEEITVTGGGGGGGGGGGSGGGGGNTGSGANGSNGTAGSAGSSGLGGAGGAGASTVGQGGTDTGGGDGAPGGQGGAGEAGVAGEEYTWFNYANAKLIIRVWTVDSLAFVVSATKPASDELTAHIPIASVDGADIRQHQVGSITLTLPAVSYCPPEA